MLVGELIECPRLETIPFGQGLIPEILPFVLLFRLEYIFRFDLVLKLVSLRKELTLVHLNHLIEFLLRLPAVKLIQFVQISDIHSLKFKYIPQQNYKSIYQSSIFL